MAHFVRTFAIYGFLTFLPLSIFASAIHDAIEKEENIDAIRLIGTAKTKSLNDLYQGDAPIHAAIKKGLFDVVESLILANANKNILSADKETPALLAFKLDKLAIFELLLRAGASFECGELYKYIAKKTTNNLTEPSFNAEPFLLGNLAIMFDHEGAREILPYVYPLFASDEDFLLTLTNLMVKEQVRPWQVSQVLYGIVHAGFLNGHPSLKTLKSFAELLQAINASPSLRFKLWTTLKNNSDKKSQVKKAAAKKNPVKNIGEFIKIFDELDPTTIALAMTEHDRRSMMLVTPPEIRRYKKDKNADGVISNILQHHHIMSNFWAYFIVSEAKPELRQKRFIKLARIAKDLSALNNFWGLSQLVMGAGKPEVVRVLDNASSIPEVKYISDKLVDVSDKKQIAHRATLIKIGDDMPRIPMISHLLFDYEETYNNSAVYETIIDWVIALSQWSKSLLTMKHHMEYLIPANKAALQAVGSIPLIPDDIIVEYSSIRKAWTKHTIKREMPTIPLREWTPMDVFSFIDQAQDPSLTEELLDAGIWDGEQVHELLYAKESEYEELKAVIKALIAKIRL